MSSSAGIGEALFILLCMGGLFLAFIAVGIFLIVRSRRDKEKAQQSLNWPGVTGKVLEARIIESTSTDSDGGYTTMYRPYVQYEYEVGGTVYTGDKIGVGLVVSTSGSKKSQETVARYPMGSSVRVFVNPNDPADAVLEQKAPSKALMVVGIIFLVAGACLVLPIGIAILVSSLGGG